MLKPAFHRRAVNEFRRQNRPSFDANVSRLALDRAKLAVPIWEIWARLGLPHPPERNGPCRAPWREDRSPSFSINAGGMLWNDFAESKGGDAVAFIARATGCSAGDAIRQLLAFAGMGAPHPAGPRHISAFLSPLPIVPRDPEPEKEPKPLPAHRTPEPSELSGYARIRRLGDSFSGLELMVKRGLLHVAPEVSEKDANGNPCRVPAFLITDAARRCATLRRCDGKPWEHIGGKKSRTWSAAAGESRWPVGAAQLEGNPADVRLVVLVEGGPDMLAAHALLRDAFSERPDLARSVVIVGMVSGSSGIHPAALPLFAGRSVRIVPHADEKDDGSNPGEVAAHKWHAALTGAGASVSVFRLRPYLPAGGKDLNDATSHAFDCEPGHGDDADEPPALTLALHLFAGITA